VLLRSALLTEFGFRHGFSLRAGGVSVGPYASMNLGRKVGDDPAAVEENQRRFAAQLGYDAAALCEVEQVHGGVVRTMPDERDQHGDALLSTRAPIGIRVADCAAVLIADPASGAVAAAHAGWRGVVAGAVPNAVRALGSAGLVAAVFPCIGVDAFEVGEDVAQQIAQATGDDVVRRGTGRPHVDLQRAVYSQLIAGGLLAAHVELVTGCTVSEPSRFFSYRRDGGVTGRHLAVILPRC
jgi:polyphenol oxidase